ncbi:MAG: VWA domain-containing protein [Bryobacteraceae bacterium]|nr:VWA domain-containing protein [Bryobacteraceae bacterium]MDW8377004.1 VWA domain-containing protein [Bryobacterales bacterium]
MRSLCCVWLGCVWAVSAQEVVFRSEVALVRVDAQVIHGERVVTGLTKTDFVVLDNDQPQPVLYFNDEAEPLDLVLVLDTSGSMRTSIQQVSSSASQALAHLRSGDRVAVTKFSLRATEVLSFTEDFKRVSSAIEEICQRPFRGGTNIHGALKHAAKLLQGQPRGPRRRAVLLISDGLSAKFSSQQSVLEALWEADAVVHALLVNGPGKGMRVLMGVLSPAAELNKVNVPKLADATGGDVMRAEHAGDGFREMMERIRRRYSLHYALPAAAAPGEHTVKVELTGEAKERYKGARIKARKGYVHRPSKS